MKTQTISKNLELNYKKQRLFSDKDHFTMYEFSRLLKIMEKSYKYEYVIWLKVIYHFGLSMSEFVSLRAESLDLKKMKLEIKSKKQLTGYIEIPKILIQDIKLVRCSKKDSDYLFNVRENRPIHASTLKKLFNKIQEQTGQTISIQKIKRSLAIHLLEFNWQFEKVRKFLRLKNSRSLRKLLGNVVLDNHNEENIYPIDQICRYYESK